MIKKVRTTSLGIILLLLYFLNFDRVSDHPVIGFFILFFITVWIGLQLYLDENEDE